MTNRYALGIDAGGTYFKAALISEDYSVIPSSLTRFPAGDTKEGIIDCYLKTIRFAQLEVEKIGGTLIGIGVSTPGPFDYENATSYMKHKLQGIYGVNLREEIYNKGISRSLPIKFLHDGLSFLLGEYIIGTADAFKNIACITLGTGTGFSVMKNGILCKNEDGNTAFSIYSNPFHNGIVEDYLSKRGIIKLYKELSGSFNDVDVLDIEYLATKDNDKYAYQTFAMTGSFLAESIKDILIEQNIECLILGGQISKGFSLMKTSITAGLADVPTLKLITKGNNLDFSPQIGVSSLIFKGDY